jgi:hypothetical protein
MARNRARDAFIYFGLMRFVERGGHPQLCLVTGEGGSCYSIRDASIILVHNHPTLVS